MKRRNIFIIIEGVILLIAIVLIMIFTLLYFSEFNGELEKDISKWGATGDFFGGVLNPVIALLALIAIILTIKQSRKNFETTLEELAESRKAQNDTFRLQLIENKQNTIRNIYAETEEIYRRKYKQFNQIYYSFSQIMKEKRFECTGWSSWDE